MIRAEALVQASRWLERAELATLEPVDAEHRPLETRGEFVYTCAQVADVWIHLAAELRAGAETREVPL